MGVPGFFLWLMKNYKKEGFVFNKSKLVLTDISMLKKNKTSEENIIKAQNINAYTTSLLTEINNIDWFLIDAN